MTRDTNVSSGGVAAGSAEARNVAFAGKLTVDRRRRTVDLELPGLEAGLGQERLDELRRLAEGPLLSGHARLAAQLSGQVERLVRDRPHVDGGHPSRIPCRRAAVKRN